MHILDIRGRLLFLGSRGHRSIAVVLQVVGALLRVGGLEVGVLVGVVVGQGHLAKLLLRGERLRARLEELKVRISKNRKMIKKYEIPTGFEESCTAGASWKPSIARAELMIENTMEGSPQLGEEHKY